MEKWFIGAAIGQRYIEGAGTKQEADARDFKNWIIKDTDDSMPLWLTKVSITPDMKIALSNSSIGSLFKCLINREKPLDPVEQIKIGYYDNADEPPEEHHIFPTRFCIDHIPGWNTEVESNDHALNICPLGSRTNRKWDKMDPKNQIIDIKYAIPNDTRRKEILDKLFLSEECISILERSPKKTTDYYDFLDKRFKVFLEKLEYWDFKIGTEDYFNDPSVDIT